MWVEREPVTVRLHGPLAEAYGAEHAFRIGSAREALAALDANYPGFRRDFLAHDRYALIIDDDVFADDGCGLDVAGLPVSRAIDICPVVEGRIVAAIAPLFVSAFGIGLTAATIISGVLVAGLLIGVSLLLSPKPKKKTAEDSVKDVESYMFSGPDNVIEQGVAVPLIYGRPFVGSVVISAGLEVNEIPVPGPSMLAARAAIDPPAEPLPPPAPLPDGWSALHSRIWRASAS